MTSAELAININPVLREYIDIRVKELVDLRVAELERQQVLCFEALRRANEALARVEGDGK